MPEQQHHILELFDPSEYISAFELDGRDVTVTIRNVVGGLIEGENNRKAKKPVVNFTDWPKPLVLNKTNAKVLVKLYGVDYTKWPGKRITMYPTTAKMAGEEVDAIRFRKNVPRAAEPKAAEKPAKSPQERAEAGKAAMKAATSIDALQAAWKRLEPLRTELDASGDLTTLDSLTIAYEQRQTELKERK